LALHALLAFKVSIEKSALILMGLPSYVICFFFLKHFNILSVLPVLVVLTIISCAQVLFWSSLFGVLEAGEYRVMLCAHMCGPLNVSQAGLELVSGSGWSPPVFSV
jgi:hypothetical protein